MYKILAIDGGVIRGLVSAMVLAEIERCTGKRIAEMFDLVAGTSSGGILALALTKPGSNGKPAHTAEKLIGLFETEGKRIFPPALIPFLREMKNWILPRYSPAGLEEVLEEYLGETRLKEALKEVLIVSYATEHPIEHTPEAEEDGPGAQFFSRKKAMADPKKNFLMRDVARATSAGPTFFPPKKLELVGDPSRWYTLIDGSVVAGNPAMCAFAEARERGVEPKDILLVSVGAGSHLHTHPYGKVKRWGRLQWVRPILDILIGGVGKTVDFHLQRVLPKGNYYRFQAPLHPPGKHPNIPSTDFDSVDKESLEALKRIAREDIIAKKRVEIDELCKKLKEGS